MRFYTIEIGKEPMPAVSADGGKTAFLLKDLGMELSGIAELVRVNAAQRVA